MHYVTAGKSHLPPNSSTSQQGNILLLIYRHKLPVSTKQLYLYRFRTEYCYKHRSLWRTPYKNQLAVSSVHKQLHFNICAFLMLSSAKAFAERLRWTLHERSQPMATDIRAASRKGSLAKCIYFQGQIQGDLSSFSKFGKVIYTDLAN